MVVRGHKFFFKLVVAIITCLSICINFLCSPTNAYEIATPVNPTGRTWQWGNGTTFVWTTQQGNTEYPNSNTFGNAMFIDVSAGNNSVSNFWILKAVAATTRIDFKKDHYYKTQLSFNFGGGDKYGVQMPQLNRFVEYNNAPFRLMNISPSYTACYEISSQNGRYATGTNNSAWSSETATGCLRGYITYDIIIQATRSETAVFQLGDGASWFIQMQVLKDTSQASHSLRVGTLTPLTIMEFEGLETSTDYMEQQKQEDQQQGEQGNSQSNTAGQQVEQGTQNILSVLTGFIGAFTNASATNCNFNTGEILGNIDMCSTQIPAVYNVILSLVTIIMVVPMVIWLFNSIISAFKEFQT